MLGKTALAFLMLCFTSSVIPSEELPDSLHQRKMFTSDFADYLYVNRMWDRAATEYLRVLHDVEGDTTSIPVSSLRLARCWHELGDYQASLGMYTFLADRLDGGDLLASALMGAGSVFEETGYPSRARTFYLHASGEANGADIRDRSRILAALSAGTMGDWQRAVSELEGVASMGGPGSGVAASLAIVVSEGDDLPGRSSFWCGVSSAVLPGSGQIICGNLSDGLVALGTNAVLGYLFVTSLDEEDTATSVLFGWLSLSFYGGNIYGGVRAAERYNLSRRQELFERITAIIDDEY